MNNEGLLIIIRETEGLLVELLNGKNELKVHVENVRNHENFPQYYNRKKSEIIKLPSWNCNSGSYTDTTNTSIELGFTSMDDPRTYYSDDPIGFLKIESEILLPLSNKSHILPGRYNLFMESNDKSVTIYIGSGPSRQLTQKRIIKITERIKSKDWDI